MSNGWIAGTIAVILGTVAVAQEKTRIEKLDDLPRHTYKIEVEAAELFTNDEMLAKLASEIRSDLESDLSRYEIPDKTTVKGYYGALGTIALLQERYQDYLDYSDKIRELEDKPALKLTEGLFARAYARAKLAEAEDVRSAVQLEMSRVLDALPFETVEAQLKQTKSAAEIYSRNLLTGVIRQTVQPMLDESGGQLSKEIALQLLGYNYLARIYLPNKDLVVAVLDPYLAAHTVEKADMWAEREVDLSKDSEAVPVILGIWDSGVDPAVFQDRMWKNSGELPGNAKDDDRNGFVDDVYGIAYTLHSDKTTDVLLSIQDIGGDRAELQRLMKGITDMQANLDSEEASAVKRRLSTLKPEEARPFIEDITKFGIYAHGTHVAGIAVRDNPFARILAARITFDHRMVPEKPTIEQARKEAIAMAETIDYFKRNGVRVVNMSWGGDRASIERALEQNSAGGTPEERKELAREIFRIGRDGLYEAIKDAPEILFVTSAGNDDNDVNFEELIPANFDLPNIMTVGAVDQAGDETGFTSFGKCDVYANGFEVESYVPGGDRLPMSGTSMSSPQVTNLVGKMLAVKPELKPTQVRQLIIDAAEPRKVGDRQVRLIHPVRTMEMVRSLD